MQHLTDHLPVKHINEDSIAATVITGSEMHDHNNRYKELRRYCLYSNSRCDMSQTEVEKVMTCYV